MTDSESDKSVVVVYDTLIEKSNQIAIDLVSSNFSNSYNSSGVQDNVFSITSYSESNSILFKELYPKKFVEITEYYMDTTDMPQHQNDDIFHSAITSSDLLDDGTIPDSFYENDTDKIRPCSIRPGSPLYCSTPKRGCQDTDQDTS